LAFITEIWRERLVRYAPIILWIGVIFYLSSDNGSLTETSRFIGPLLHFLFPTAPEETIQAYHAVIRKSAHFFEYAVLALLVFRAMVLANVDGKLRFVIPVAAAAIVSVLDELNQSFEASRSGSPWDVALDISGAVTMVVVLALATRLLKRDAS
jgi:VanZ family protein